MYKTFQIYYLLVGNVTSVLIIKFIGMSVGMAIWNVVGITVGWIFSRFGILGSKPQGFALFLYNFKLFY
jgi:hypothetical protein